MEVCPISSCLLYDIISQKYTGRQNFVTQNMGYTCSFCFIVYIVSMRWLLVSVSNQQQVLQAKVEELIEQRKLNQYTHLTFGDEDIDSDDTGGRVSPLEQQQRTVSPSPGEVE